MVGRRSFDLGQEFDDETERKHVGEIIKSKAPIAGVMFSRPMPFATNLKNPDDPNASDNRLYGLRIDAKLDLGLPARRGLAIGSGRCASASLALMYTICFPEYVYSTHEQDPNWAIEAYPIYTEKSWDKYYAFQFANRKLSALGGRYEDNKGGIASPIHRWMDSSAFHTPFLYAMMRQDHDLEIVVTIRDPKDFYKSCEQIHRAGRRFFIARYDYGIYMGEGGSWDWGNFWYDTYKMIYDQLKAAHRPPRYVWEFSKLVKGEYIDEMLEWWDIPLTDINREKARWYLTTPGNKIHRTETCDIDVPDLSFCDELWNFWKSQS